MYSVSSIFLVIEYWLLIHISSRVCYNIIIEYHRFYHRILYILWSNFPWVIFPCIICRIFSPHLKQLSLWRPHYCSAAKIVEFRSGLSWSVLLLWLARRCELQFSLHSATSVVKSIRRLRAVYFSIGRVVKSILLYCSSSILLLFVVYENNLISRIKRKKNWLFISKKSSRCPNLLGIKNFYFLHIFSRKIILWSRFFQATLLRRSKFNMIESNNNFAKR